LLSEMAWRGIVREFKDFLPVSDRTPELSLHEGNTPLIEAWNLVQEELKNLKLYFKFEGLNPTASFKDRGMAMAIAKALEEESRAVICASTGNTSASAAAYAARAGMTCIVLIPRGKIARGKLSQALVHGAAVIQVEGNFDEALGIVKAIVRRHPITLVNSINPFRLEGQKTAAFEVCEQMGGSAPRYHVLPVGNAGNITAYWMGYKEYRERGRVTGLPTMLGFQAEGAAPIVLGRVVEDPHTIATAIRIGNPASWKGAVAAMEESGGAIGAVTDEEILSAYKLIAAKEGIFCEPASAASLAGVRKLYGQGYFEEGATVVCTLTGHGLKDPDTVFKVTEEPVRVKPEVEAVERIIEGIL
jgi:threonine synthase